MGIFLEHNKMTPEEFQSKIESMDDAYIAQVMASKIEHYKEGQALIEKHSELLQKYIGMATDLRKELQILENEVRKRTK